MIFFSMLLDNVNFSPLIMAVEQNHHPLPVCWCLKALLGHWAEKQNLINSLNTILSNYCSSQAVSLQHRGHLIDGASFWAVKMWHMLELAARQVMSQQAMVVMKIQKKNEKM